MQCSWQFRRWCSLTKTWGLAAGEAAVSVIAIYQCPSDPTLCTQLTEIEGTGGCQVCSGLSLFIVMARIALTIFLTTVLMQLLKSFRIWRVTEIATVGSWDSVTQKDIEALFPKFFYFIKGYYKSTLSSIPMVDKASIYWAISYHESKYTYVIKSNKDQ